LWAIINNAGISKGSEIEITSIQKIEEVIDVNLMGTIRVTKAFLPLLRRSKGRVINVASAAGELYKKPAGLVSPKLSRILRTHVEKKIS
ncbi:D-beta-hydroxybutyrate dehydrogenase, mitochondrial, partial [Araneus ventricosus]